VLIVDAHLDLAYNALRHGRRIRLPLDEARQLESPDSRRGRLTVTLPALRQGGVGLAFATIFVSPQGGTFVEPDDPVTYRTPDEAHRLAIAQIDFYHRLADEEQDVRLIGDAADLEAVVASHASGNRSLLGIVLLMEGADPIRQPEEAELWYERGLRAIGPAWDDTRYSAGAWREGGGLTSDGYALLETMADLGFILDLTHMSEKASLQAMERYEGVAVATHSNARALVPGERHWSNTQIRQLAERDGVVGIVLYNRFLKDGYSKGDGKALVPLTQVVAHIDHICQLVGDARHVGIGSDMDGGFGADDIPAEMDSAADLPLIGAALGERGYSAEDVAAIMGGNWLAALRRAWSR
jgi:membrane dipeptidase